jgi:hypothetical protein
MVHLTVVELPLIFPWARNCRYWVSMSDFMIIFAPIIATTPSITVSCANWALTGYTGAKQTRKRKKQIRILFIK